jgi:hypothetical protein
MVTQLSSEATKECILATLDAQDMLDARAVKLSGGQFLRLLLCYYTKGKMHLGISHIYIYRVCHHRLGSYMRWNRTVFLLSLAPFMHEAQWKTVQTIHMS